MVQLIGRLRALGFGGLLGGGLAGLVYSIWPNTFATGSDFQTVVTAGAIFGAGLHGVGERIVLAVVLGPLGKRVTYYTKLWELRLLVEREIVPTELGQQLLAELTASYILELPPSRRTLQPTSKPKRLAPKL